MARRSKRDFDLELGIIPIRIRTDLEVKIGHVPYDLTKPEAEKISNVILSLAAEK